MFKKTQKQGIFPSFPMSNLCSPLVLQSRVHREGCGISARCSEEAVDMLHSHIGHPRYRGHCRGSCCHQQHSQQKLKAFALVWTKISHSWSQILLASKRCDIPGLWSSFAFMNSYITDPSKFFYWHFIHLLYFGHHRYSSFTLVCLFLPKGSSCIYACFSLTSPYLVSMLDTFNRSSLLISTITGHRDGNIPSMMQWLSHFLWDDDR